MQRIRQTSSYNVGRALCDSLCTIVVHFSVLSILVSSGTDALHVFRKSLFAHQGGRLSRACAPQVARASLAHLAP